MNMLFPRTAKIEPTRSKEEQASDDESPTPVEAKVASSQPAQGVSSTEILPPNVHQKNPNSNPDS